MKLPNLPPAAAHFSHRRELLRGLFLGAMGSAAPLWAPASAVPRLGHSRALHLPSGPLAQIGPLEKKTPTSGALPGIDEHIYAPAGFTVRVVARQGLNPISGTAEGFLWHPSPDGGAVFAHPHDGGWVYVSNSEAKPGGASALRFNAAGQVVGSYPILTGTQVNCSGGATPWGTWLSCEEFDAGQVYECDPFGVQPAVVKPALGVFRHEAVAIDPINHTCYLTEDGGDQRFYRFASSSSDLHRQADGLLRMGLEHGRLEVLKIKGFDHGVSPSAAALRGPVPVEWVSKSPLPGFLSGGFTGSYFAGGEGVYYYTLPKVLRSIPPQGRVPTVGVIFFATKGDNRIYALDVENQLLEIIFDNDNLPLLAGLDDVDNLTVSPAGDVLVAEDGEAMRLCVVVPHQLAKVLVQIGTGGSEITGPAFSPDGSRLYFSSQRGPSGINGRTRLGVTFELSIPPAYRRR